MRPWIASQSIITLLLPPINNYIQISNVILSVSSYNINVILSISIEANDKEAKMFNKT